MNGRTLSSHRPLHNRITSAVTTALAVGLLAVLVVVSAPAADAQTTGDLTVTPGAVEVGQSFSLAARNCPGPQEIGYPPGTTHRVEFGIDYLTPPQLPGDPPAGSYSVRLIFTTLLNNGWHVASWSLPANAPTLGGAYRISADCISEANGQEVFRFAYDPIPLSVSSAAAPVLAAGSSTVAPGGTLPVTATGCPTPPFLGASYRVEYALTYLGTGTPYQQIATAPGAFGDHATNIVLGATAPAGAYELTARCMANELGSDFEVFTYSPSVPIQVTGGNGLCEGRAVTVNLADGQVPTEGDDVILGTTGNDVINGRGGNDTICALEGDDRIVGGSGNDRIMAGPGNDLVWGGDGDDWINGLGGIDRIRGGAGADTIYGGSDRDIIVGQDGNDQLFGEDGRDTIDGGDGADVINGGNDTDFLRGRAGNDVLFSGNSGNDRLVGDEGNDSLQASATSGSTRLVGGDGDDLLIGSAQLDRLWGNDGNDRLYGAGYRDLLRGGAGNDIVSGGFGADALDGGSGNDNLDGGAGDGDFLVGLGGSDRCDGGSGILDRAHHSCELILGVP